MGPLSTPWSVGETERDGAVSSEQGGTDVVLAGPGNGAAYRGFNCRLIITREGLNSDI